MKEFFVYVIYSLSKDRRYVGMTQNIEKRLAEHNSMKVRSTKGHVPWVIIHTEPYQTRKLAREREVFLKSGVGRKWLDENIKWPRSSTE